MNRSVSRGFSFVEILLITGIIAVIGFLAVPRFLSSKQRIELDSVAKKSLTLFQLVQQTASTLKQSTSVLVTLTDSGGITQFKTTLPGHILSSTLDETIDIPASVSVLSNVTVDKITFLPNQSWHFYLDDVLVSSKTFSISFRTPSQTDTLAFYPLSSSIQLQD